VTERVLGRMALIPPLAVSGWLIAGLILVLAGWYRPVPAALAGGALAIAFAVYGARSATTAGGPRWVGAVVVALVAGFGVLAWLWSSGHLVVRRDPGTYAMYADWLRRHGSVPIPAHGGLFGPGVSFASPGFYQRGDAVVPQFMSGLPMVLAAAGWLGGVGGILHGNAVIGAAALLAVAGLAARVAGPVAAAPAALLAGLAYPMLHAARSPYSEPLALLLLAGGLCLLADGRPLLGGLVAGLAVLVRVDGLVDLLPLVPYAVVHRPRWRLAAGLALGAGLGLLDGALLSRPYLGSLRGQLLAVGVALVALIAASLFAHRRWRGMRLPGWLPRAAAAVVMVGGVLFWIRPYLQTVRQANRGAGYVGQLQSQQGLAIDPRRTYAEHSLHWLAWWLGVPGLVVAIVGLALLTGAVVAGRAARAAPFLLVVLAGSAVVLWRPAITPDHPWADRRFVAVALPGLAICAGYVIGRLRRRPPGVVVAVAAAVPVALASWPLVGERTEAGEPAAVRALCARLGPHDAVVVTGVRGRLELPQVVRGSCGVPAGAVSERELGGVLPAVTAHVSAAGRQLWVLSEDPGPLRAAGLRPVRVVDLHTREDARLLTARPHATVGLDIQLWLATA
jgi:hypothetical protein